jgi:hypothetical protein
MWGQPPRSPNILFDDIFAPSPAAPAAPVAPIAAAVQAKPQSHAFFREGGPGRTIVGILADALAGAAGGTPIYAPMMAHRRLLQEQRDEEARKANLPIRDKFGEDYVEIDPKTGTSRVLYRGTPKAPGLTGYAAELVQAGFTPGTPEYIARLNQHLSAVDDPIVTTTLPGDRIYSGPRSQLAAALGGGATGSAAPPPAAVEYLKAHPDQATAFEQKYGAGTASQYLGGPTPPASGSFR